jgi:hypothetical protein
LLWHHDKDITVNFYLVQDVVAQERGDISKALVTLAIDNDLVLLNQDQALFALGLGFSSACKQGQSTFRSINFQLPAGVFFLYRSNHYFFLFQGVRVFFNYGCVLVCHCFVHHLEVKLFGRVIENVADVFLFHLFHLLDWLFVIVLMGHWPQNDIFELQSLWSHPGVFITEQNFVKAFLFGNKRDFYHIILAVYNLHWKDDLHFVHWVGYSFDLFSFVVDLKRAF